MDGRKPKDRDFLETKEGMLFCVTGYLHPPDKYTAYLKYSPAPVGKWRAGEVSYRRELEYYRVDKVADTIAYLEQNYPTTSTIAPSGASSSPWSLGNTLPNTSSPKSG